MVIDFGELLGFMEKRLNAPFQSQCMIFAFILAFGLVLYVLKS